MSELRSLGKLETLAVSFADALMRIGDAALDVKQFADQYSEQAKADKMDAKEARLFIEEICVKRGLSERTVRRYLPTWLKRTYDTTRQLSHSDSVSELPRKHDPKDEPPAPRIKDIDAEEGYVRELVPESPTIESTKQEILVDKETLKVLYPKMFAAYRNGTGGFFIINDGKLEGFRAANIKRVLA